MTIDNYITIKIPWDPVYQRTPQQALDVQWAEHVAEGERTRNRRHPDDSPGRASGSLVCRWIQPTPPVIADLLIMRASASWGREGDFEAVLVAAVTINLWAIEETTEGWRCELEATWEEVSEREAIDLHCRAIR